MNNLKIKFQLEKIIWFKLIIILQRRRRGSVASRSTRRYKLARRQDPAECSQPNQNLCHFEHLQTFYLKNQFINVSLMWNFYFLFNGGSVLTPGFNLLLEPNANNWSFRISGKWFRNELIEIEFGIKSKENLKIFNSIWHENLIFFGNQSWLFM